MRHFLEPTFRRRKNYWPSRFATRAHFPIGTARSYAFKRYFWKRFEPGKYSTLGNPQRWSDQFWEEVVWLGGRVKIGWSPR